MVQGAGGNDIEQTGIFGIAVGGGVGVAEEDGVKFQPFGQAHRHDEGALQSVVVTAQLMHRDTVAQRPVEPLAGSFALGDEADAFIAFGAAGVRFCHNGVAERCEIGAGVQRHRFAAAVEGLNARCLAEKLQPKAENLSAASEAFVQRITHGVFDSKALLHLVIKIAAYASRQALVDVAKDGRLGVREEQVEDVVLQRVVILRLVDDDLADAAIGTAACRRF